MAAPMVSGTLVLLMERYPDTTTDFLTQTLHEQTTPLNLTDPLLEGLMGSGSLNIDSAIDCDLTGDTSGGQAGFVQALGVANRPL